jgi:purine-binding chemotaxis protein CheW
VNPLSPLVVFTLDEQHYALRLASVERVARRVELTPLPKALEIVLGVINVQGRTIPVVNLRKRFGLAERELHLSEHIILAHTLKRAVVLVVDAVHGIIERSQQEVIAAEEILPGLDYLEAVTKLKEGLSESLVELGGREHPRTLLGGQGFFYCLLVLRFSPSF